MGRSYCARGRREGGGPQVRLGAYSPAVNDQEPRTFGAIFRRLGPAGILALVAVTLPALGGFLLLAYMDTAGKWLRGHGTAGIWVYVGGFMVAAGLAVLPTYSLAALGGWAFGMPWGFLGALAGFGGGALIGYATGRMASGERVERLIEEKPQWRAVRDALVGNQRERNFLKTLLIVTLLRLPPNSPFAVTNLVLASVRVPVVIYVLGTLVGMAPRTFLVAYLASRLQSDVFDPKAVGQPKWMVAVGIGSLLVVFFLLNHIARKALGGALKEGTGA